MQKKYFSYMKIIPALRENSYVAYLAYLYYITNQTLFFFSKLFFVIRPENIYKIANKNFIVLFIRL